MRTEKEDLFKDNTGERYEVNNSADAAIYCMTLKEMGVNFEEVPHTGYGGTKHVRFFVKEKRKDFDERSNLVREKIDKGDKKNEFETRSKKYQEDYFK